MIEYGNESFMECKGELMPLFEQHYEEIALNKDKIALNPNWDGYNALDQSGLLQTYTVRSDGKLCGYFVVLLIGGLHYKDHIFAANDLIYIDPTERKGFTAWRLLRYAEQDLKERGVSAMHVNVKKHKPFDKLLLRLGYTHIENLYSKYIGGA